LHRVLVPAGRSGRLALIDPDTLQTTSLALFSATPDYSGGHDDGPTSVDEAGGRLAVTDRTTQTLVVFEATAPERAVKVRLGSGPDYVRFVPLTHEIWVTEPDAERIEVFADIADAAPAASATIAVAGGPESLVVDATRGRAYTHRWHGETLAIDVKTRAVVGRWSNGCTGSRGIAVDERRGWLFASCSEGTVTVLDPEHEGALLSRIEAGGGFDVFGYSEQLGHLYLSGSSCHCTVVLGVDARGRLSVLERAPGPAAAHCAVGDDRGHFWVCAPETGSVLRSTDKHAASLQ
jgi:DNA-binding beta-propeller fold protein YncE